jgi:2-polyprenyl-6-methoxyphenol hydroxylase-like FAD-dependent oxidoreductase
MRGAIPSNVAVIAAKAAGVSLGPDRQSITLPNGEEISARLVVMANGLNTAIRRNLGMDATVISPCHSISIGFDLKPTDRTRFDFHALTYFGERPGDRVSYLSLFPTGSSMRANLFVYRSMDDPWLREMRKAPQATLFVALPRLKRLIGDFEVTDVVKVRPVDLYETAGYRQDGLVLVGDAFATSCPAAGTGTNKVLVDVERLCNGHIPAWLATPGMTAAKIDSFYGDPVKQESDAQSKAKAFHLRSLTLDTGLLWRTRRWSRFGKRLAVGTLRNVRRQLPSRSPGLRQTAAATKSGQ